MKKAQVKIANLLFEAYLKYINLLGSKQEETLYATHLEPKTKQAKGEWEAYEKSLQITGATALQIATVKRGAKQKIVNYKEFIKEVLHTSHKEYELSISSCQIKRQKKLLNLVKNDLHHLQDPTNTKAIKSVYSQRITHTCNTITKELNSL